MNRRDFIRSAGGLGIGAAIGGWTEPARAAQMWGELPPDAFPNGANYNPPKILEVFLYGGLSPWETFYCTGKNDQGCMLTKSLRDAFDQLVWNNAHPNPRPVGNSGAALIEEGKPFGNIFLGGVTRPIWDFTNKMRVITMRHELGAHQVAIPLALTGRRLGFPSLAGLGTAISHRYKPSLAPTPRSYVVMPRSVSASHNLGATHATGLHPAEHRPFVILMDDQALSTLLERNTIAQNSSFDPLLAEYSTQYGVKLTPQGGAGLARSVTFTDYQSSLVELRNAPALKGIVNGLPALKPFQNDPDSWYKKGNMPGSPANATRAGIETAAALLRMPETRYACFVDAGVKFGNGTGYDTHEAHALPLAVNVWNLLWLLADQFKQHDNDPTKGIDFSNTLIVLNTEFGRKRLEAPFSPNAKGNGRDHWTFGYTVALMGGGVAGPDLVGSIDVGGNALGPGNTTPLDPTDLHAALLVAAGINPFEHQNFGEGQFGNKFLSAGNPQQGAKDAGLTPAMIRTRNLGRVFLGWSY